MQVICYIGKHFVGVYSGYMVMNKWSYASTPSVCLQGLDRDNFKYDKEDIINVRNMLYWEALCWYFIVGI
jgi:hypothetical protein